MKLAPRTRVVPLYDGDAEDRLTAAREAVAEAEFSGQRRANRDPVAAAKEAFRAAVEAEEASAVKVTLTSLSYRKRSQILDACPPRVGNEIDQALGYDRDKFWWDSLRAMLVEPAMTDDEWQEFSDSLSEEHADALGAAMQELRSGVDVPKSSLVSAYLASETD